ncbi:MAG TPA: calycin-like domain-containing protein, partial [Candidatus Sumerlaeia bacterium]|nr:calycin-like domain-containing protein [Candidatus Sumerlaeia bacterium]
TTSQQNATISVNKQTDGKYTLSINNFVFGNIGIGNIAMKDIEQTKRQVENLLNILIEKKD